MTTGHCSFFRKSCSFPTFQREYETVSEKQLVIFGRVYETASEKLRSTVLDATQLAIFRMAMPNKEFYVVIARKITRISNSEEITHMHKQ